MTQELLTHQNNCEGAKCQVSASEDSIVAASWQIAAVMLARHLQLNIELGTKVKSATNTVCHELQ